MQPDIANAPDTGSEVACQFGEDAQLVGVYTHASTPHGDQPCALFLTAGLLHHVGPHRLYVEMARALATDGAASLRFDLAGVGDSETRSGGGDFAERSVIDVQSAMSYLTETFGHTRFVLIGLCSGADDALATAARDPRVVGTVLLNGYAYRAGQFMLHRILNFYLPRLFVWQKVRNRVLRLVGKSVDSADKSEVEALTQLDEDYRDIPPIEHTGKRLAALTDSGTQLLFVYTGSEHDVYTYQGQLFDMFPRLRHNPRLREQYIKEADHTFVLRSDRDKLTEWVRSWYSGVPFRRVT